MNAQLSEEPEDESQHETDHSLFTYARHDEDIQQLEEEQLYNDSEAPADFA